MTITNQHKPYLVLGQSKKMNEALTDRGQNLLLVLGVFSDESVAWKEAEKAINTSKYLGVYVHKQLGMAWIQHQVAWENKGDILSHPSKSLTE